jgi:hypothetical protein
LVGVVNGEEEVVNLVIYNHWRDGLTIRLAFWQDGRRRR